MVSPIADIFAAGIDFAGYRGNLTVHAARFDEVYEKLEFVRHEEAKRAPLGSSRVLVLAEAFCIDAVLNIPLIARLAEASPESVLRFVSRDAHPALAAAHPGRDGQSRVPTVILLNSEGEEQGYWSERSARDHEWMAAFLARDPIPPITLDNGRPTALLADWMTRRFDGQFPFFVSGSWCCVRDELGDIASGIGNAAMREPIAAAPQRHD